VSTPHALEVTGDLDQQDIRDGRSGYDLGAGHTGCDGGIDERPHEEGVFASLSPPFSGKTEVTRELDEVGPSPLSNADRPRPVGTPVWWERAVHREGYAAALILHSFRNGFIFRSTFLDDKVISAVVFA
jgi:hypothetical protein